MVILGKDYGKIGDDAGTNLSDEEVSEFVKAHPDRFIGFCGIHPDREKKRNLERVDRAVNDLGLRGIKLNPHSGFYPNDERLYPVYEFAQDIGIPVMIHSGVKAPQEGTRLKYCKPIFIDDVLVDFPNLIIIISHAGYPWVEETIASCLYAGNAFVDISTLNQLEEAMGGEVVLPTLKKLTAGLGAHRVLFGSDGIFNIEALISAVKNADFLDDRAKKKILGENAKEILNL
ncbi:MAG: amidohydrolase [Candidatus Schekmanbacteria bacterium]|nr:MAG: amidohydrolase [Candidatus Schekmanbacteria bacterium]